MKSKIPFERRMRNKKNRKGITFARAPLAERVISAYNSDKVKRTW